MCGGHDRIENDQCTNGATDNLYNNILCSPTILVYGHHAIASRILLAVAVISDSFSPKLVRATVSIDSL